MRLGHPTTLGSNRLSPLPSSGRLMGSHSLSTRYQSNAIGARRTPGSSASGSRRPIERAVATVDAPTGVGRGMRSVELEARRGPTVAFSLFEGDRMQRLYTLMRMSRRAKYVL